MFVPSNCNATIAAIPMEAMIRGILRITLPTIGLTRSDKDFCNAVAKRLHDPPWSGQTSDSLRYVRLKQAFQIWPDLTLLIKTQLLLKVKYAMLNIWKDKSALI